MEETMGCLLGGSMEIKGAPAKCSEDAKGGGCRLELAKDYGRKTVGEKAMLLERRQSRFDQFSWPGVLTGRRWLAGRGRQGRPDRPKGVMRIRRLRKGSRVTPYRHKSCVAECRASCGCTAISCKKKEFKEVAGPPGFEPG